MANKFKIWDENRTNIQTYSEFDAEPQRQAGFTSGLQISSRIMNTALRQANLVVCALMNVIAPNDQTVDVNSSVNDVQQLIDTYLNGLGRTITLNGSVNTAPTFYAPTTAGTAGRFLMSNGSNQAPTWVDGSGLTKIQIASTSTGSDNKTVIRLSQQISYNFADNCDVKLTFYLQNSNGNQNGGITVNGRATKKTVNGTAKLILTFETFGGSSIDDNNEYPLLYELRGEGEYNNNKAITFTCKQIAFHNTTSSPYTITDVSNKMSIDHDRFFRLSK